MKSTGIGRTVVAIALLTALGGCSTWHSMDKTEGTVAGGASGAVAGAVVGGPVGAVVGGVGGAIVGNETSGKDTAPKSSTPVASANPPATYNTYDPALVRSVQMALRDKGYNPGSVDGNWGPSTQDAVRRFQQASGLPQTGELGRSTLNALGVS